jgi:hypothetical protein
MAQPSSRSEIGPGGVQAGSTKVSNVARCPAAMVSLSTPAKVTAMPSKNIAVTASHGTGATNVPTVIRTAPLKPRPA